MSYTYIKNDLDYYYQELVRVQDYKSAISHVLDGLPSGNVRKRPEEKWADLMDYTDEIIEYLGKQMGSLKRELEVLDSAIKKLPAREAAVLTARYITGRQFKDIAKDMPLSDRTIYHAHRNGVAEIEI